MIGLWLWAAVVAAVGYAAGSRGRNPWLWGGIAAVASIVAALGSVMIAVWRGGRGLDVSIAAGLASPVAGIAACGVVALCAIRLPIMAPWGRARIPMLRLSDGDSEGGPCTLGFERDALLIYSATDPLKIPVHLIDDTRTDGDSIVLRWIGEFGQARRIRLMPLRGVGVPHAAARHSEAILRRIRRAIRPGAPPSPVPPYRSK